MKSAKPIRLVWIITPLLFFAYTVFLMSYHEMWRDEMAAFLLSRDSSSFLQLIQDVRYEGHSVLWYICLRIIYAVTGTIYSMQFLSAIVSTVAVYIFVRYSPFLIWQKLFFVFGFFFLYEYTVISRDYCLTLPLLFGYAAMYSNARKNYMYMSAIIFTLCLVNVYSLIVAGALFSGILYKFQIGTEKGLLKKWQLALFIFVCVIGLAFGCYQITPPHDIYRGFSVLNPDIYKNILSIFTWNQENINKLKTGFILGFVSIPVSGPIYWDGSSVFYPDYKYIFPSVITLLLYTAFVLRKQIDVLVTFVAFITALVVFSYSFYQGGSQRHFGIMLLFWVAIIWMGSNYHSASVLNNRIINWAASILFAMQFIGGIQASSNEIKYTFSNGKDLARFLEDNGYLNESKFIISAYPDWAGLPVIGYLPKDTRFYYYHGRLYGTYNISDARRGNAPGLEVLGCEAYKIAVENNKEVILILQSGLYKSDPILSGKSPLYESKAISTVSEDFTVIKIGKFDNYKFCK